MYKIGTGDHRQPHSKSVGDGFMKVRSITSEAGKCWLCEPTVVAARMLLGGQQCLAGCQSPGSSQTLVDCPVFVLHLQVYLLLTSFISV